MAAWALLVLGSSSVTAHDPSQWIAPVFLHASLDAEQVVSEPGEPASTSQASGTFSLLLDSVTGEFSTALVVSGIRADQLSPQTSNWTSVLVREGGPDENGPVLIDLQFYGRRVFEETDGVDPSASGFSINLPNGFSTYTELQGTLEVGRTLEEMISLVREGRAHVVVHSTNEAASPRGEIRGNIGVLPPKLRLRAELDGASVVRARRVSTSGVGLRE